MVLVGSSDSGGGKCGGAGGSESWRMLDPCRRWLPPSVGCRKQQKQHKKGNQHKQGNQHKLAKQCRHHRRSACLAARTMRAAVATVFGVFAAWCKDWRAALAGQRRP
mmetsp:Transcript_115413/g.257891  ORF Transcript_115413/g.257891 Transcript_115413/m.257891 type:complete len:107 (-) Transcript_115413:743-1063(-)